MRIRVVRHRFRCCVARHTNKQAQQQQRARTLRLVPVRYQPVLGGSLTFKKPPCPVIKISLNERTAGSGSVRIIRYKITTGSSYFKNLKEPTGFMKGPGNE